MRPVSDISAAELISTLADAQHPDPGTVEIDGRVSSGLRWAPEEVIARALWYATYDLGKPDTLAEASAPERILWRRVAKTFIHDLDYGALVTMVQSLVMIGRRVRALAGVPDGDWSK